MKHTTQVCKREALQAPSDCIQVKMNAISFVFISKKLIFLIAMICISLGAYAGESQAPSNSCSTSMSSKKEIVSTLDHYLIIQDNGQYCKDSYKELLVKKDSNNKYYLEIIYEDCPIVKNTKRRYQGRKVSQYRYYTTWEWDNCTYLLFFNFTE